MDKENISNRALGTKKEPFPGLTMEELETVTRKINDVLPGVIGLLPDNVKDD